MTDKRDGGKKRLLLRCCVRARETGRLSMVTIRPSTADALPYSHAAERMKAGRTANQTISDFEMERVTERWRGNGSNTRRLGHTNSTFREKNARPNQKENDTIYRERAVNIFRPLTDSDYLYFLAAVLDRNLYHWARCNKMMAAERKRIKSQMRQRLFGIFLKGTSSSSAQQCAFSIKYINLMIHDFIITRSQERDEVVSFSPIGSNMLEKERKKIVIIVRGMKATGGPGPVPIFLIVFYCYIRGCINNQGTRAEQIC